MYVPMLVLLQYLYGDMREREGKRQTDKEGERDREKREEGIGYLLNADGQSVHSVDGGESVDVLVHIAAAAQGEGSAGAGLRVHFVASQVTPEQSLPRNRPRSPSLN